MQKYNNSLKSKKIMTDIFLVIAVYNAIYEYRIFKICRDILINVKIPT